MVWITEHKGSAVSMKNEKLAGAALRGGFASCLSKFGLDDGHHLLASLAI
jgi:hypothetical protein